MYTPQYMNFKHTILHTTDIHIHHITYTYITIHIHHISHTFISYTMYHTHTHARMHASSHTQTHTKNYLYSMPQAIVLHYPKPYRTALGDSISKLETFKLKHIRRYFLVQIGK